MAKQTAHLNVSQVPKGITPEQMIRVTFLGRVTSFREANPEFEEDSASVEFEATDVMFEPMTFRDAAEMAQAQVRSGNVLHSTPPGIGRSTLPST